MQGQGRQHHSGSSGLQDLRHAGAPACSLFVGPRISLYVECSLVVEQQISLYVACSLFVGQHISLCIACHWLHLRRTHLFVSTLCCGCNVHLAMQIKPAPPPLFHFLSFLLHWKDSREKLTVTRYVMSTPFGGDQSVGCAAVLSLSVHSSPFVCASHVQCDCLACNAGRVTLGCKFCER